MIHLEKPWESSFSWKNINAMHVSVNVFIFGASTYVKHHPHYSDEVLFLLWNNNEYWFILKTDVELNQKWLLR